MNILFHTFLATACLSCLTTVAYSDQQSNIKAEQRRLEINRQQRTLEDKKADELRFEINRQQRNLEDRKTEERERRLEIDRQRDNKIVELERETHQLELETHQLEHETQELEQENHDRQAAKTRCQQAKERRKWIGEEWFRDHSRD